MTKVRETNDWLLTEEIAAPDVPVLVLFEGLDGRRSEAGTAFFAAAAQHAGPARFFRAGVQPKLIARRNFYVATDEHAPPASGDLARFPCRDHRRGRNG